MTDPYPTFLLDNTDFHEYFEINQYQPTPESPVFALPLEDDCLIVSKQICSSPASIISFDACEDLDLVDLASPNSKAASLLFPSKKISKKSSNSDRVTRSKASDLKNLGSEPTRKRSAWSSAEDEQLRELYNIYGPKWAKIASEMAGRTGKQVRDRYLCALVSDIKKDPWTQQEDRMILTMLKKIGAQWARISESLEGRTEMQVKNRYNTYLKKHGTKLDNESEGMTYTQASTNANSLKETPEQSPRTFEPTDMISYGEEDLFVPNFNFGWENLSSSL